MAGGEHHPPAFITYFRTCWLPTNLPRPFYKNQALVQADTLACRIELLNKDIVLTAVSLLDQRNAAVAKREWLLNELNNLPATD